MESYSSSIKQSSPALHKVHSGGGNVTTRQSVNEQAKRQKQSIKKLLLDYQYIEAVNAYDLVHDNDQLIQYFAIIGMDDPDITHTLMTVKEMIHADFGLNNLKDEIGNNSGILSGKRAYYGQLNLPKFQVPVFQPKILSKVPEVDRAKLLFPINLADFLFKDGLRVMSAHEIYEKRAENKQGPNLKQYPYISNYGTSLMECTTLKNEKVFTNQEGKMYVATSIMYFIDLADLEIEFGKCGHFKKYNLADTGTSIPSNNTNAMNAQDKEEMEGILKQKIPSGHYFLSFQMCFITLKPFKAQLFQILQSLYKCYVNVAMPRLPKWGDMTFEQCLNKIMFGIPAPPKRAFEYMSEVIKPLDKKWVDQQKPVVEVNMFEGVNEPKDKVYFQNENAFDLPNSNFENIWVLLRTLSAEHILQLFKRLLFSTCNILVSDNAKKLNQCIQGITELFFPITCDLVVIPNLPETMLEYVNMCGQCVIGVVKYNGDKKLTKDQKRDSKSYENHKEHTMTLVNGELINLFDVMQDNSCQIYLDVNYSIQKPRQVVGFNAMGKLALGQSAAKVQSSSKPQQNNQTVLMQAQQGNQKQPGVAENLNDVELPKENTKNIRQAISKAQKDQDKLIYQLEARMLDLKKAQLSGSSNITKIKNDIHHIQCKMQSRVLEVRLEFYRMIRTIILAYTDKKQSLLFDFKGARKDTRHMTNFMRWNIQNKDIFTLIDKKAFKNLAKSEESQPVRQQFYQRLVYYPMLQNYIIEKFFPSNIEDNINQLHGLAKIDIYKKQYEVWLKNDSINKIQHYQQNQFKKDRFFASTYIYPSSYREKYNQLQCKKRTMLRAVNEVIVRKDFLEKFGEKLNKDERKLGELDKKFIEILKTPHLVSEDLGICNVVETKYRMTIYYEKLYPRQNILITWLLLFIGSLEYQLNPWLFTEESQHKTEKILSFQHYKNYNYYAAQNKTEQILTKYFEEVLKVFLYKIHSFFDQKCPLLNMLFQYTQKYTLLHQKLIDFVHQEVDQQQAGQSQLGSMAVSNSFMIYQLHWDNNQFRTQSRRVNEKKTLDALKKATIQEYQDTLIKKNKNHKENALQNQIEFDKKVLFIEGIKKLEDLQKYLNTEGILDGLVTKHIYQQDPVLLNQVIEKEWTYSRARLDYLRDLAALEQMEDQKSKTLLYQMRQDEKLGTFVGNSGSETDKKSGKNFLKKTLLSKIFKGNRGSKVNISQLYESHNLTDVDTHGASVIDDHFQPAFQYDQVKSKQDDIQQEFHENLLKIPKLEFDSLINSNRSFFSLKQLTHSRKIKDNADYTKINPDKEQFNLDPHIELDLVCGHKDSQSIIEDFLNFKSNNKTERGDASAKIEISIQLVTELASFEITRVNAMHPKAVRSGVETLLRVCKNYKTIQQIDMSAFSQDKNNEDYYWNLIFWFKYKSLPYLWLAPFLKHLGGPDRMTQSQASNQQDFDFGEEKKMEDDLYFKNPSKLWLEFFSIVYRNDSKEDLKHLVKLLTQDQNNDDNQSVSFSNIQGSEDGDAKEAHAAALHKRKKKFRKKQRQIGKYNVQKEEVKEDSGIIVIGMEEGPQQDSFRDSISNYAPAFGQTISADPSPMEMAIQEPKNTAQSIRNSYIQFEHDINNSNDAESCQNDFDKFIDKQIKDCHQ